MEEIISIQNPQLVMLPTVHLKDKSELEQVPLTFLNLSLDTVWVARHTLILSLHLYVDYQDCKVLKYTTLVQNTTLPCIQPSAKLVCSPAEVNTHRKSI